MANPIVILHGWSDNSRSFQRLSQFIRSNIASAPVHLYLADWLSMHDDVTYADLAAAMQQAWLALKLPTTPQSVDLVVHSTGALVARHWFTQYYSATSNPIKRFVQLAPANFGSHLAHKGRSFFGRAVKGWGQLGFQTGAALLKGLELASEYSRELAKRDLFADESWYGAGKMLCSIFIGDTGYSGINAIANEAGSDGTVRICGANLNSCRLSIALDAQQQPLPDSMNWQRSKGEIAFTVLPTENHSTIVFKGANTPNNPLTSALLLQALTVTDAEYEREPESSFLWQQRLDELNPVVPQISRSQLLCALTDQFALPITDYFLEMYRKSGRDQRFEEALYRQFLTDVHVYSQNPAYRAFYFDTQWLAQVSADPKFGQLYMSFNAQPLFQPPKQPVGYLAVPANTAAGICLPVAQCCQLFQPQQTVLLDVQLTRLVHSDVFKIQQHSS